MTRGVRGRGGLAAKLGRARPSGTGVRLAIAIAACSALAACSGTTAGPGGSPTGSTRTPTATVTGRSSTTTPEDSRALSVGVMPAMDQALTRRWQASEEDLFQGSQPDVLQGSEEDIRNSGGSDGFRPYSPPDLGYLFPGRWNPDNGGRFITLATSSTQTRVRSFDMDAGTKEWEATLDGVGGRCAVNQGPEMVCSTPDQLVFLAITTGEQTRTLPIAGVKELALGTSGDIYTASWDGPTYTGSAADMVESPLTEARLTITVQRVDPTGAVRWSSTGDLTTLPFLSIGVANDAVIVSQFYPETAIVRDAETGQPFPGTNDGDGVTAWGPWLLARSADGATSRVLDASGTEVATVPGQTAREYTSAQPRDVPESDLPLVTRTTSGMDTAQGPTYTLNVFDDQGVEKWKADGVLRAVCGGVIMTSASNANTLTARDPDTGAERWSRDGDVLGCDRTRFIILSGSEAVVVDAADGREAWATDLGGAYPYSPSAHDEGLLVIEPGNETRPTFALYR